MLVLPRVASLHAKNSDAVSNMASCEGRTLQFLPKAIRCESAYFMAHMGPGADKAAHCAYTT